MTRSPRDVLEDHLRRAREGDLEGDLARNFAPDVAILSTYGARRGLQAMRELADLLSRQLPDAEYDYVNVQVEGEMGFLEWTARSARAQVRDGADSYLIRDGRIRAQTIHYTVEPLGDGEA